MAERAYDGFEGVMGADFSVSPAEPPMPDAVVALYPLPESRRVIFYQGTVKGRLSLPRGDA